MLHLKSDELHLAAELLRNGEIVAFPTETVYGLGASLFDETAIASIFKAKGRPSDNPLIAHLATLDSLDRIVESVPASFYKLQKFIPGPLTVVLKKREGVPSSISGGQNTIAIRFPAHPIAKRLIELAGPLVAPSANLSGRPSPTTAQHVIDDLGERIAAVIDGGPCQIGIESTVLSLLDVPTLLRPGSITKEEIERALGCEVKEGGSEGKPLSPGMKYRHYAPDCTVHLITEHKEGMVYQIPTQCNLYAVLRRADQKGVKELYLLCTPEVLKDKALMNRLEKAALKK